MGTAHGARQRRPATAKIRVGIVTVLAAAIVLGVAQSAPAAGIYWGAWIDGNVYGGGNAPWDATTLSLFEQHAGKRVSIIHMGQSWMGCTSSGCSYQPFDSRGPALIRQHGSIPLLTWSSWASGKGANQPNFQLADIINGVHDSYIRSWAQAAKAWGKPFFLRFDPEMNLNGARFPYQENTNGNKPGEFVKMWRHVVTVFKSVGAKNVTWVWCPNKESPGSIKPLSSLYPGDSYVNWTCLDGYNWGTNPSGVKSGWHSFEDVIGPTYDLVTTQISSRPMMIGETGSTEVGGSKAEWTTDMFVKLPTRFPDIRALIWFNRFDAGMDWPIESSSSAQDAFAVGVASPLFPANTFGTLATSPIPPP